MSTHLAFGAELPDAISRDSDTDSADGSVSDPISGAADVPSAHKAQREHSMVRSVHKASKEHEGRGHGGQEDIQTHRVHQPPVCSQKEMQ